jgi:hypothetical protein
MGVLIISLASAGEALNRAKDVFFIFFFWRKGQWPGKSTPQMRMRLQIYF